MSNRLSGKVVIVTGAAQGIGFGCASLIAAEGAAVVLGDLQEERGELAAARIRSAGGKAHFCIVNVKNEEQCSGLVEEAIRSFGRLDGLVNNAGWFPRATLEGTTTELWDEVMQVNLRGAFYCCKHATPVMRKAGGSIVNMGSICGIQSLPNLVAYGAAKGGLLSLTRTLAGSLAEHRIRVNYVIPGWVLTEGELAVHKAQGREEETLRKEGEKVGLGRHQTPLDTAHAVVFLLSDDASQITGTVLHIDAGASTLPIAPGAYPG
ncbi:MAG TPA: SDR family NAD(P)-dependent oxidoreductase [Candidatus Acidoferrales bacterium]|nr:SDR family NAD(P)-dependent oxidoreductase [Candidatus Acidoferrales bacterium]